MKTKKLRISIALAFALLTIAGALTATTALGGESPVARAHTTASGPYCPSGPPECGYAVIQDAVDTANNEDHYKVATGTYTDIRGRTAPLGYNGPPVITQWFFSARRSPFRAVTMRSTSQPARPSVQPDHVGR